MRRLTAPILLLALLVGVGVVTLAAPGVEPCVAQAAGDPNLEARLDCPGGPAPIPGVAGAGQAAAGSGGPATAGAGGSAACAPGIPLLAASAAPRGRGLRLGFQRRGAGPVTVELFRVAEATRVVGTRRVARFLGRTSSFTWSGRGTGVRDGLYVARFRAANAEGRRIALRRRGGRWTARPAFDVRGRCEVVRFAKAELPVFGGRTGRALKVSYRLDRAARVTVTVTRAGRTVRRLGTTAARTGRTYRLLVRAAGLRRGDHRIRLSIAPASGRPATVVLTAARL